MEQQFWLERWEQGQIGFHQSEVHPELVAHADRFLGGGPRDVLVPLCGKTVDLTWLARRGHAVTGVELAEAACKQFHDESGITPTMDIVGAHRVYRSEGLAFVLGDWFTWRGRYDRVWDRAAMVALPPSMRAAYVAHLKSLAPGGVLLLSTFTYDTRISGGPPFSIEPDEVERAYPGVTLLREADVLAQMPAMRARGHQRFVERTWMAQLPDAT